MLKTLYRWLNYIYSHLAIFLLIIIDAFLFLNWIALIQNGNTHQAVIFVIVGAIFNIIIVFMHNSIASKAEIASKYNYIKGIFGDIPAIDVKDIVNLSNGLNEIVDMLLNSDEKSVIDIPIDRLSILWREGGILKQENVTDDTDILISAEYQGRSIFAAEANLTQKTFNNDIVNNFYNKLRGIIQSVASKSTSFAVEVKNDLIVTYFLLYLLDYYGNCPSVVNVKNNNNRNLDGEPDNFRIKTKVETTQFSEYDLLSHIPLAEHSVRVAENAIEIAKNRTDSYYTVLSSVIAALAHDIGKIPNYYESGSYTTYQHPSISANIIKNHTYFKKIPAIRRNLILNAVELHHSYTKSAENMVLETLRQADKQAREDELTMILAKINEDQKAHINTILKEEDKTEKKTADVAGQIAEEINHTKSGNENNNIEEIDADSESIEENNPKLDIPESGKNEIELKQPDYKVEEMKTAVVLDNKIKNDKVKKELATFVASKFEKNAVNKVEEDMSQKSEEDNKQIRSIYVVPSSPSDSPDRQLNNADDIETDIDFGRFIDQKFLDVMFNLIENDINIVRVSKSRGIPYWNAFTYHHEIYVTGVGLRRHGLYALSLNPTAELLYKEIVEEDEMYNRYKLNPESFREPIKRHKNLAFLKFIVSQAKKADLIETSKIQGDYFGGKFIITMQDKQKTYTQHTFYTVFKASAFKTSFEDLEKRKKQEGNDYLLKIKELVIDPTKKEDLQKMVLQ